MLQLLKESVSSKHNEYLEQVVIALIGIEIGASIVVLLLFLFSSLDSTRNHYHPSRFVVVVDVPHAATCSKYASGTRNADPQLCKDS